eukprot:gnl/Dysnectes_brevis/4011_a5233_765.p1 GENE.gnl/Dysnectes_brevis/4011_a5233_765~~gnl/Dysnectes_brevis/4011_a5233_765.p1  ORF type:complete len:331 (+),score=22.21 gnl/Dysnectes_brevis/4011_a5233_765:71-994(+)
MQLEFSLQHLFGLKGDDECIFLIDREYIASRRQREDELSSLVNSMGVRSMNAQGLSSPVTTFSRLLSTDQRLYVAIKGSKCLGILKVGSKHLFMHDSVGRVHELDAQCILDFYVHETCQRRGIGMKLVSCMADNESRDPSVMAFDRPSSKLRGFLAKHLRLSAFTQQVNGFLMSNKAILDQSMSGRRRGQVQKNHKLSLKGHRFPFKSAPPPSLMAPPPKPSPPRARQRESIPPPPQFRHHPVSPVRNTHAHTPEAPTPDINPAPTRHAPEPSRTSRGSDFTRDVTRSSALCIGLSGHLPVGYRYKQ